jgi:O-antigen/teichoic acid export membrane protein
MKLRTLLQNRPLVRNIATVASGAAAAQALGMVFAPLVTRLYGPDAFGVLGMFTASVGLLAVLAGLSWPAAVVVPQREADAVALARLALLTGTALSLLLALGLAAGGPVLLGSLGMQALVPYLGWVAPAVWVTVAGRVLSYWLIRREAFALSARWSVGMTLLVNIVKVGAGAVAPSAGVLVATHTGGTAAGAWLTWRAWRRIAPPLATKAVPLREVARRFADFPRWRAPQDFINALSQSLPLLVLGAWAGVASAGQYGIALTVLGMPAVLLGHSVMSALTPRVNAVLREGGDVRPLIVRSTSALAGIGALPFLLVMLAGPQLFAFVFGDSWMRAGEYARWLSPWLYLQLLNQPAVAAIPGLHLQRGLFVYELFSSGGKVLALALGLGVWADDLLAVALFSAAGTLAYVALIGWVLIAAGRPRGPQEGAR